MKSLQVILGLERDLGAFTAIGKMGKRHSLIPLVCSKSRLWQCNTNHHVHHPFSSSEILNQLANHFLNYNQLLLANPQKSRLAEIRLTACESGNERPTDNVCGFFVSVVLAILFDRCSNQLSICSPIEALSVIP